jgi:hypothetical protein
LRVLGTGLTAFPVFDFFFLAMGFQLQYRLKNNQIMKIERRLKGNAYDNRNAKIDLKLYIFSR